jgi:hypothetical protein
MADQLFDIAPGEPPARHLDTEPNASWSTARARGNDPDTSHAAAASVTGLTRKQQAVLECLRELGEPVTDQHLAREYHARGGVRTPMWPDQSDSGLRTRRSELVARGAVVAVGTERLPSGRMAKCWAVAGTVLPGGGS